MYKHPTLKRFTSPEDVAAAVTKDPSLIEHISVGILAMEFEEGLPIIQELVKLEANKALTAVVRNQNIRNWISDHAEKIKGLASAKS